MKKLEPYPIALASFFIFTTFYIVCVSIKLLLTSIGLENIWMMDKIWLYFLPGFSGLDSFSILIGLLVVSIGSYTAAYLFTPIYNFLIRKSINEYPSEIKSFQLRFKVLFITFLIFLYSLFILCILYDLMVPKDFQMYFIWQLLLPGFEGLRIGTYLFGIFDIFIYSLYTSFIISTTLNYFEKSQKK